MSTSDALRFGCAIGIILLWAGAFVGLYGDAGSLNLGTPLAFAAATFLFATPVLEARRKSKEQDDDR